MCIYIFNLVLFTCSICCLLDEYKFQHFVSLHKITFLFVSNGKVFVDLNFICPQYPRILWKSAIETSWMSRHYFKTHNKKPRPTQTFWTKTFLWQNLRINLCTLKFMKNCSKNFVSIVTDEHLPRYFTTVSIARLR